MYIRDRKSTRLNSSHLVISYAVFCLKKKNDHLVGQPPARCGDPLPPLLVERVQRDHPVLRVAELVPHLALAVVEVRHQAVVTDGSVPTRDLEQLLTHTPEVHIDDDGRKWPVLLWVGHE